MNRRVAIAQLVAPEATRQSTSRSRSVSEATFCSAEPNAGGRIVAGRLSGTGSGGAERTARAASRVRPRGRRASRAPRAPARRRGRGAPGPAPRRTSGRRSSGEGSTRSAIRESRPAMGVVARVRCSCLPESGDRDARVVRVGTLRFRAASGSATLRNRGGAGAPACHHREEAHRHGGVRCASRLYERTAEIAAIDAAVARLEDGRGSCRSCSRAGPVAARARWSSTPCSGARERGARTWVVRARHLASAAPFEVLRRLLGPAVEEAGGVDALDGRGPVRDPAVHARAPISPTASTTGASGWSRGWPSGRRSSWPSTTPTGPTAPRCGCCSTSRPTSRSQPVTHAGGQPAGREPRGPGAAGGDGGPARLPGARAGDALARGCGRGRGGQARSTRRTTRSSTSACKVSRGNAFYLHELLRPYRPTLSPTGRPSSATGTLSLRRTVAWRLGELGPEADALAQAAAVLGDGCSLHLAAELARLDEATAVYPGALGSRWPASCSTATRWSSCTRCSRAAVEAELPEVVQGELHARAARLLWLSREGAGVGRAAPGQLARFG